jgi:putative membrane protein
MNAGRPISATLTARARLLFAVVPVLAIALSWFAAERLAPGMLVRHMALHLILMNMIAPFLAWLDLGLRPRRGDSPPIAVPTVLQLALLWAWHAPAVLPHAMRSPFAMAAMMISLLAVSLMFWSAILRQQGPDRWRALAALMATAKLYCLLGILLVFSPRLLYGAESAAVTHNGAGIEDQQLAGLMMIAACPLVYVAAGIVVAATWFRDLQDNSRSQALMVPAQGRRD